MNVSRILSAPSEANREIILITTLGCSVQLQRHPSRFAFKGSAQYENLSGETHHLHPKKRTEQRG